MTFKYLTKPYQSKKFKTCYCNNDCSCEATLECDVVQVDSKFVPINKLDFNKENFYLDKNSSPTYESFNSEKIILLDDEVCYFRFFVTNSNDKVFCTRHGDFILTYNDIRNGICLIPVSC